MINEAGTLDPFKKSVNLVRCVGAFKKSIAVSIARFASSSTGVVQAETQGKLEYAWLRNRRGLVMNRLVTQHQLVIITNNVLQKEKFKPSTGDAGLTGEPTAPVAAGEGGEAGRSCSQPRRETESISAWVAAAKGVTAAAAEERAATAGPGPNAASVDPAVSHVFQETTYRIPTPCDACQKPLRGHTRQGIKCKMCKVSIHHGCQAQVSPTTKFSHWITCCVQVRLCRPRLRQFRRNISAGELTTSRPEPELRPPAECNAGKLLPPPQIPVWISLHYQFQIFQGKNTL